MASAIQRSFSGGEIAPSLYARVDLVKYATGLRTCRNFAVAKHGGVFNRSGSEFVVEVKDSSKRIRKIPFVFNSEQTYVLEFGNQYMRVIRNGAQIEVSGVTAWSNATAYVVGDLASRLGVNYYCISAHTNQQPPNATYWHALTGDTYEIPTPYLEADLQTINFDQSGDVITLTHPSYQQRELARTGHTAWTLSAISFAPSISAPTGVSNSGAAGSTTTWVVSSVASETFEESLASSETSSSATPSSGSPITVSWSSVSGAREYNVYKKLNGVYGFIGTAVGTSFVDNGIEADTDETPPEARNPFNSTDNYPSTSTYFQQRHIFANTNNDTEKAWGSKSGSFKNMSVSFPYQDDDALDFRVPGRNVNEIKHMLDLGKLIVLTSGGEWVVNGDAAGILRAGEVWPTQQSYNGCGDLRPLIAGNSALFVQARGSIVRDLAFTLESDGYDGDDLTVFSSHLFEGYTITDWDYQQTPQSIVWVVRSDGVLLGLTYVKAQKLFAWHRHDTDGTYENVCVVPEGGEDVLYVTVKRTINGQTKRYIERMSTRLISDIKDATFMDSFLTYDGRNTGSTTMTISGGTTWAHTETLTLTASASYFVAGDVGNAIHLNGTDSDGNAVEIRFTITGYTSANVVEGYAQMTVPASMRSVATTDWGKAVDVVSGIDHLEGENVSIFADGFVVANPNNDAYTVRTVSSGSVTLDRPYVVIHVGLPYTCDLETLDIDSISGETMADKMKNVTKVTLFVEKTRGLFVGPSAPSDDTVADSNGLTEYKHDVTEDPDSPVDLVTGTIPVTIRGEWNSNGRIFIRQTDPIPASILAVVPSGLIPFKGA